MGGGEGDSGADMLRRMCATGDSYSALPLLAWRGSVCAAPLTGKLPQHSPVLSLSLFSRRILRRIKRARRRRNLARCNHQHNARIRVRAAARAARTQYQRILSARTRVAHQQLARKSIKATLARICNHIKDGRHRRNVMAAPCAGSNAQQSASKAAAAILPLRAAALPYQTRVACCEAKPRSRRKRAESKHHRGG